MYDSQATNVIHREKTMEESRYKGKEGCDCSFENVMSEIDISLPREGVEWTGDLEFKMRSTLKNEHSGSGPWRCGYG